MFRFEYSAALYLLWLLPLLWLLFLAYMTYRKKQMEQLGKSSLLQRLTPGFWSQRARITMSLWSVTILLSILAFANPQWGNKKDKVKALSSDVYIALDISQSMMATDISPNRLERSKRLIQNLIQALRGNRIGLIFFAGNAYLQMPLSSDYSAAQIFAASANTSQAGTQGTAIEEAIDLAMKAYEPDKAYQRALIVITDGEDHDGDAISKAEKAKTAGLNIFAIGVGSSDGAFVPYMVQGQEQYKRDEQGNPVKSALNSELIRNLANAGGGKAYFLTEGNELIGSLKRDIDLLEKQEVEQKSFSEYASYYQYLLMLALICLLIDFLIPMRKNGYREKEK